MSGIDELEKAEEAVEQARDERRAERVAELRQAPLEDTAAKQHHAVRAPLAQVRTLTNMRTGGLPEVQELAVSIKETGLLNPPLVRAGDDPKRPYELLAGRRRLAAMALIDEADGVREDWRFTLVDGISRREALTMQFAENFHQVKPEPVQFARAARAIMGEDPQLTAADVSRLVGAPAAWTRRALKLLDLPAEIVDRVERGDLSFTVADVVRRGIARGDVSTDDAAALVAQHAEGALSGAELKQGVGERPRDGDAVERARWDADREQDAERREWFGQDGAPPPPAPAVVDDVAAEDVDGYLIGLVLGRVVPEDRRRALGLRDQAAAHDYAFSLRPEERLGILRSLGAQLLAEDPAPPRRLGSL